MTTEKKALIGLHDRLVANASMRQLRGKGFVIDQALDLQAMQEYCGNTHYDFYVMDLNLGKAGSTDITPSRTVYQLLQQQGIAGLEHKFIGISGRAETVDLARQKGLPAYSNTDLSHILQERLEKEKAPGETSKQ